MLREYLLKGEHHRYRREISLSFDPLSPPEERMCSRFEQLCAAETPVLLPEEKICFIRTIQNIPDIFNEAEWVQIREKHFIHELGYHSNLSVDYEGLIRDGLLARRKSADCYGRRAIDSIIGLSDRYREEALRQGRQDIADVLMRIPRYGAQSFREALQFFRILHFALWLEGNYHNTAGRFDQYIYPYLKKDIEQGLYTEQSALELLEDFFLSFNKDSDLYAGVQQGDNGQSMVLGGIDKDGNDGFNLLSRLCLRASGNLRLIDPKINLRVSKNTPLEVFELGSELTRAGLGFPQYSNDDVVIKGLTKLGYDPQDARNYVVAACWEFIIPAVGEDVANIGALSFPRAVDRCLHRDLPGCGSFGQFMQAVKEEIERQCDEICGRIHDLWFVPSPFLKACMGKIKYHNFGIHGTGIATAADSLYAIQKYIFEEKRFSKKTLLEAVDSDFEKHEELLPLLRYETPKMGMDCDDVDSLSVLLLDWFADSLQGRRNCLGGCFRAGTGSAMYYLWHAGEIGASPDGRRRGEPFGTNFSPSLFARTDGPVSVVRSFTKQHFTRAINGGPLTLEFHHSMFSDSGCIRKVALLVQQFIALGGHQLQLNAVNLEQMRDAQLHPEKHRQLVVRIWGWSAYFVELDKEYQDHVMRRQEYAL
ncbi:MAG: pyruvate formate-lyase [Provencibacterium sp.]|nr:pyruvate formate-lyase [Provencibacterium sp.]